MIGTDLKPCELLSFLPDHEAGDERDKKPMRIVIVLGPVFYQFEDCMVKNDGEGNC